MDSRTRAKRAFSEIRGQVPRVGPKSDILLRSVVRHPQSAIGWAVFCALAVLPLASARAIEVTAISPDHGWTGREIVDATITGSGFPGFGIEVFLRRAGEPDIVGTNVVVESSTTLTCRFALTTVHPHIADGPPTSFVPVAAGVRDVVVRHTFLGIAVLPEGFHVRKVRIQKRSSDSSWGGLVRVVRVVGNRAYVARGSTMAILDITDPANMIELGSVDLLGCIRDLDVGGNWAVIVSRAPVTVVSSRIPHTLISIADITDPANPSLVVNGIWLDRSIADQVRIRGTVAYFKYGKVGDTGQVNSLDISDPWAIAADPFPGRLLRWIGGVDYTSTEAMTTAGDFLYEDAGAPGGRELRIRDLAVDPLLPPVVGTTLMPLYQVLGFFAEGNLLCAVGEEANGSRLVVVDITNPAGPFVTGFFDGFAPGASAIDVSVSGGIAYVAGGSGGMTVIDVGSNPFFPTLVGTYTDALGPVNRVTLSGTTAYLADAGDGLTALDVTDPANPVALGSYLSPGHVMQLDKEGDVLYGVDRWRGAFALDATDPDALTLLGTYPTGDLNGFIQVRNALAYVGTDTNGLLVIDFTDPANPILVGGYQSATDPFSLTRVFGFGIRDNILVLAGVGIGTHGMVFDLTDPVNPVPIALLPSGSFGGGPPYEEWVISSQMVAYTTGQGFDLSDPLNPVQVAFTNAGGDTALSLDEGRSRLYTGSGKCFEILAGGALTSCGGGGAIGLLSLQGFRVRNGVGAGLGVLPTAFDEPVVALLDYVNVSASGIPSLMGHSAAVPKVELVPTSEGTSDRATWLDGPILYLGTGRSLGDEFSIGVATWDIGQVGDFDADGAADAEDEQAFRDCYSGAGIPASAACLFFDTDGDSDVDCDDWTTFEHAFLLAQGALPFFDLCSAGPAPGLGDCDDSGVTDMGDVPCFVDALLGIETIPGGIQRSDVNGDASTDGLDVGPFVAILLGGGGGTSSPCPGTGDCCAANGTPGCGDSACCEAVCAIDPFCCEGEWDVLCALEASRNANCPCGAPAPCVAFDPHAGDCCEANGTPGCTDPVCCSAVCAVDPFCCDVAWDGLCADQAATNGSCVCGGQWETPCLPGTTLDEHALEPDCGFPGGGVPDEVPFDTTDGGCNSFPLLVLPVRCGERICGSVRLGHGGVFGLGWGDTDWYELTLDEAVMVRLTGAGRFVWRHSGQVGVRPTCDEIYLDDRFYPAINYSKTVCAGPGVYWIVAYGGSGQGGACEDGRYTLHIDCLAGVCGDNGNSCCVGNGSSGCDHAACMEAVCAFDRYCCDAGGSNTWDADCAEIAAVLSECPCGARPSFCGDAGAGDCCVDNGTPFCDQGGCCDAVCAVDPFCCEMVWDSLCAERARSEPACDCARELPPTPPPPVINQVLFDPGSVSDNCPQSVVFAALFGSQIMPGIQVRLVQAGQPDAMPFEVQFLDEFGVTVGFDLEGLAPGLWQISARNADYNGSSDPVLSGDTLTITACPTGACCFGGGLQGACSEIPDITCGENFGTYSGDGTACGAISCSGCVTCPGGATAEGEAWCSVPDTVNGGCDSSPAVFGAIACGQTICGTAWADGGARDSDWYELVLVDAQEVTMTVTAEVSVLFGIAQTVPAGSGNCGDVTGLISPFGFAAACLGPQGVTTVLQPGTHWIEVQPQALSGAECATGPYDYTLEVSCVPAP